MKRLLLLIFLSFLSTVKLFSADFYWVGGSGSWSILSNWATSSGGTTSPAALPDSSDNVFFDSFSFFSTGQNVNLNTAVFSCHNIVFNSFSDTLLPQITNGTIRVFGDITLAAGVHIDATIICKGGGGTTQRIESKTGTFANFHVDCPNASVQILDKFDVNNFVLINGTFDVQGNEFHVHTLTNGRQSSMSKLDLSGSEFYVHYLKIVDNVMLQLDFAQSTMYLSGGLFSCGNLNFQTIRIVADAEIGNSTDSLCAQSGFSGMKIDSLIVDSLYHLRINTESTDNGVVEINYVYFGQNSSVVTNRNLQVEYLETKGYLFVASKVLEVTEFIMRKSSELVLYPTIGNTFSIRVRGSWDIEGVCSDRIYVRSSVFGSVSRVEASASMSFDHAQIVDIEFVGGGPQDIENSIKAGKTSGLQLVSATGRRFYWIGNSGDWFDPSHWSLTSGGAPNLCIPGILDTVIFDNQSITLPNQTVNITKNNIFIRSIRCVNSSHKVRFNHQPQTTLYILGDAIIWDRIEFSNLIAIEMLGANDNVVLEIDGKHSIRKLSMHLFRNVRVNVLDFEMEEGDLEVNVEAIRINGTRWALHNATFNSVKTTMLLSEFDVQSILNLGKDNSFEATSTILKIRNEARFEESPIKLSSLQYYGEKEVFINFFDQLDTLWFEKAGRFFSYNDTTGDTVITARVFINELGFPKMSFLRGINASDAIVVSDIEFQNCEFDFINVFNSRQIFLSGNLQINRRFNNNSSCERLSYFTKHPDSLNSNFYLKSDADSLHFNGFHIYHIDAIGRAKFVANNCVDLGNNTGFEFRSRVGRKFFWIGKKGNYMSGSNWSYTSNGTPANCIPSGLDTAIFDMFSFTNGQDTVFMPTDFPVALRTFRVEQLTFGNPVFYNENPLTLLIKKDFLQKRDVKWANPLRVSFLTSTDSSFIENSVNGSNITLSMGHLSNNSRYFLLDSLHVNSILLGFGTLNSRGHTIRANKLVADSANGYSAGYGRGFADLRASKLYIDTINVSKDLFLLGLSGYLRNRGDLRGAKVFCDYYALSTAKGFGPESIRFPKERKGVLKLAADNLPGGYLDSVIAYGDLVIENISDILAGLPTEIGFMEVDGDLEAFTRIDGSYVLLNKNALFRGGHEFQDLFLTRGMRYVFEEDAELGYAYIGAQGNICKPITIISKSEGKTFILKKTGPGVFDGQGIIMRDCISQGGVSYTGVQSEDLGNNTDWFFGRDPKYNQPGLGKPITLCENDSFYVLDRVLYPNALSYSWTLDGVSFDPGTLGFFLAKSGMYKLTVQYEPDCALVDSSLVDIYTRDRLNLGSDTIICQGEYIQLVPNLEQGDTFTWSTGTKRPFLYVERTGNYWVKVTNKAGCTISDTIYVGVMSKPRNPAGLDTVICSDKPYKTGRFLSDYSYLWNTGDTTAPITIKETGIYTVQMSNGICYVEDTVEVTMFNPIYFSLGNDSVLLEGQTALLKADTILPNYLWNTGDTSSQLEVIKDGFYTLQTINKGVCLSSDTVWVRFRPQLKVWFDADTFFTCQGDSVDLIPSVSHPVLSYLWQNGSTDSQLLAQFNQGVYFVEVKDSFFVARDTVFVAIQPNFSFSLGNDTVLCEGQTLELFPQIKVDSFLWQDGSMLNKYLVSQPGKYVLFAKKGLCISSDSVQIQYDMLPKGIVLNDTLLCETDTLLISLQHPSYKFIWSDGVTNATREFTQAGNYQLYIQNGVCADTVSFAFNQQEVPLFNLGNDTVICDNDSVIIDATVNFAKSYAWNGGETTSKIIAKQEGLYGVQIFDGLCFAYDEIFVETSESPQFTLGNDTSICGNESLLIAPNINQQVSYLWNDGSSSSSLFVSQPGTISLTVSNGNCEASDTLIVYACDCLNIFVPTAFSPNKDGLNDVFKSSECYMERYHMQIFNRWGTMVFETNDYDIGWDGTANGSELPGGVYVYRIQVVPLMNGPFGNKQPIILSGSFHLIR